MVKIKSRKGNREDSFRGREFRGKKDNIVEMLATNTIIKMKMITTEKDLARIIEGKNLIIRITGSIKAIDPIIIKVEDHTIKITREEEEIIREEEEKGITGEDKADIMKDIGLIIIEMPEINMNEIRIRGIRVISSSNKRETRSKNM